MVPGTVHTGCFPELFGFALIDPHGLDAWYDGTATGRNLLEHWTTTDEGDRVSAAGLAIPVFEAAPADYTIVVRDAATPSQWPGPPELTSTGWVLAVGAGEVIVTGLGYLSDWQPGHPRHRRARVPNGTYSVEIDGRILDAEEGDEGAYEFVLSATPEFPAYSADLSRDLGLF